jgi:hypothetical protein
VLAALSAAVLWLTALTHVSEAATRGLALEIKASEAPNAPTVETVNLYTQSYALVIGINDYGRGWQQLSKAVSDAQRVARALEKHGFDVTLRTDLKSDGLAATLKNFFIDRGRDPDARLFVWFAGHGATVDGEGYLIPSDGAALTDETGFLRKSLSLRRFGEYVRLAKSKHVFSVFDACFAGTIFNVARSSTPPAITRVTTEPVRQFLSSGDAGQEVSDDGVFASMFIEALEGRSRADANADGYLTGTEIGENLTYRMTNVTNNRQTPRSGKLRSEKFDLGDFVFSLGGPARKQESVAADKETLFWSTIKDSKRASDFEAYLQQYRKGTFTLLARIRLNELKGTRVASLAATPKLPFVIDKMGATYVAIKTANLRSEPSTNSRIVGSLRKGDGALVTGRVKGKNWYRLGKGSFVFGSLIIPVSADELAYWNSVKDSNDIGDFKKYLAKFPGGAYRDIAKKIANALKPSVQIASVVVATKPLLIFSGKKTVEKSTPRYGEEFIAIVTVEGAKLYSSPNVDGNILEFSPSFREPVTVHRASPDNMYYLVKSDKFGEGWISADELLVRMRSLRVSDLEYEQCHGRNPTVQQRGRLGTNPALVKVVMRNNWRLKKGRGPSIYLYDKPGGSAVSEVAKTTIGEPFYAYKSCKGSDGKSYLLVGTKPTIDPGDDVNVLVGWVSKTETRVWAGMTGVYYNKSNQDNRDPVYIFETENELRNFLKTGDIREAIAMEDISIREPLPYYAYRFPIIRARRGAYKILFTAGTATNNEYGTILTQRMSGRMRNAGLTNNEINSINSLSNVGWVAAQSLNSEQANLTPELLMARDKLDYFVGFLSRMNSDISKRRNGRGLASAVKLHAKSVTGDDIGDDETISEFLQRQFHIPFRETSTILNYNPNVFEQKFRTSKSFRVKLKRRICIQFIKLQLIADEKSGEARWNNGKCQSKISGQRLWWFESHGGEKFAWVPMNYLP